MPVATAPLSAAAILAELGFTPANDATLAAHLADLVNPHAVTKTQVGLVNVDNLQQLPLSYLDTDVLLAANSDVKVASQKAVKAYADAAVAALVAAAPATLDTLDELAAALGDDPNLSVTLTNLIGTKLAKASNLSDLVDASAARTNLGLVIGTNVQAFNANLTTFAAIAPSANVQTLLGAIDFAAFKSSLSLNLVENTALSTWAGSTNLTTLGTIGTGAWNATAIPFAKLAFTGTPDGTKFLRDDGSWQAAGGGAPGGSTTQLQYNNAGAFGGTAGLVYNAATNPLLVITQQADAVPALRIKSSMASGGGTAAWVFEVTDSGNTRRAGFYFEAASGRFRLMVPSGVPANGKPGLEIGTGTGAAGTGLASETEAGGSLYLLAGGAKVALCNSGTGDFTLGQSYALAFGSNELATPDVFLKRGAAAEWQVGKNAASPINQLFKAHDGLGSNIAAPDLVLAGGRNTGTPVGSITGNVRLQTSNVGAAAAVTNTLVDRFIIRGSRKLVATNNTALGLFEIVLGTLAGAGGVIRYAVFAADATDVQLLSGIARFSAVNKGGAYTSEIVVTSEAASVSAGTLTATFDILTGTNKITIRVTPNSSLTATTYYVKYSLSNESEQAITTL